MFYAVLYVVVTVFLTGVVSKAVELDWMLGMYFFIAIVAWPLTLAMYVVATPFVLVYRVGALCSEYIIDVCVYLSEVLT